MDYDAELQLHDSALRRACAIRSHEHVLDIGCGTGHTTRDAARAAPDGNALGIDTSATMIARARELAASQGPGNVRFEHGDAQTWRFSPQHFDVAISRFGTMFFADPVPAFANVLKALKADGRLVMMVWQSADANEWSVAIQQCLAGEHGPAIAPTPTSDPFSLADPTVVEGILTAAGFAGTTFSDVREPVYYGASVEAALDWVGGFLYTRDILQRLDAAGRERALARLRETLVKHRDARGVWFDSRAWIVTAVRRQS